MGRAGVAYPLIEHIFTKARRLNPERVPSLAPFKSSPHSGGKPALERRPKVEPPIVRPEPSARGPSHNTYGLHTPQRTSQVCAVIPHKWAADTLSDTLNPGHSATLQQVPKYKILLILSPDGRHDCRRGTSHLVRSDCSIVPTRRIRYCPGPIHRRDYNMTTWPNLWVR